MLQNEQSLLIIYDKPDSKDFYKKVFNENYQLYFLDGCDEARRTLTGRRFFDAIVLDVTNFLDILPFIRKNRGYSRAPIITVIDAERRDLIDSAFYNGSNDVMRRPLDATITYYRVKNLLEQKSEIDPITGVYTRQAFFYHAHKLIEEAPDKKYVILRFDIDNFNLYNNTYGTDKGDELLRHIGMECLRIASPERIFCRYDNDDFVCVVENSDDLKSIVVNKIINLDFLSGQEKHIIIRMGMCEITDKAMPLDQICERALLALNSVGDSYDERFAVFHDNMLQNHMEEKLIVDEMEEALQTGQFLIYFQPQYNQFNNTICGAEALIRWRHPQRGLIPPGAFIHIFERNGFITKIDSFVLEEVCKFQRKRLDAGAPIVPISINLSRVNTFSDEMCQKIIDTVRSYNLPERYIHFEITETAYVGNQGQLIKFVKNMKVAGFELEMDDFGAGYSSLNALKDIPVDVLKLDIRFIEDSLDESKRGKILSSVIRMAHSMGMLVIAEGVETKEQTTLLLSMGCIYVQGYYFDKPMPVIDFEDRLNRFQPVYRKDHNNFDFTDTNVRSLIFSPQATILLNNLLGPAGFLEYCGGNIEGIRFSKSFFDMMGISPERHFNMAINLRNRFDDENWERFLSAIKYTIAGNGDGVCEVIENPSDIFAEPKWHRVRFKLVSRQNNLCYLFFQMENIDDKKKLEIKNNLINENMKTAINKIPSGTGSFFYDGENIRISFINETLAEMFGYSYNEYMELYENNILQGIQPDDYEDFSSLINKAITDRNGNYSLSFHHLCKDGTYKTVLLNMNVYEDLGGEVCGSVVLNTF